MKLAWYILDQREGEAEPYSVQECGGWPTDLHSHVESERLFVVKYGTSTRYFVQAFSAFDAVERWKKAAE